MGLSSLGNQRPATTTITISHSITGGEADEVRDLSAGDAAIAYLFEKRRRKTLARGKGKGKKTKSKVALLAETAGNASPLTPLQAHAALARAARAEIALTRALLSEAYAVYGVYSQHDPDCPRYPSRWGSRGSTRGGFPEYAVFDSSKVDIIEIRRR